MAVKGRAYGLPKDAYDPLTEHEGAADPHSVYLTPTEANAVYAVTAHGHTDYAASTHGHGVYQLTSEKGQPSGYAGLGTDTKVPIAQLPTGTDATQVAIGTHTHAVGAGFSAGVSNIGNTAGSTGVTGTRLVLVGTNAVSLSQSTDANGGTISINVPTPVAQTVETLGVYALGNTTGQSSSSTRDLRSVSVQGDGIVSVGMSAGILRLSATVAAQTNQSGGIYALGNTVGQSSSSTHDARTLSIMGDGILSVGWSGGSLRLSVPAPAAQTAESQSHGMSNLGNTAGTTGIASGANVRLLLAGGANITLSQSLNGASGTITVIGPAAGGYSAGVSNLGNTAGATGVTGTRMVLVGAANITLSQTTDANGNTVSMSVAAPGAGGFVAGISNLGNTAGATGVTGTRLVLVGANNITLSQTTDANGGTVSMSVAAPGGGAGATGSTLFPDRNYALRAATAPGQGSLWVAPIDVYGPVQFDRAIVPLYVSNATNSTMSATVSLWMGLYTLNGATLSSIASGSATYAMTNQGTGSSASYHGYRGYSIGITATVTHPNIFVGVGLSTATGSQNGSISLQAVSNMASVWNGLPGVAVNASNQMAPGLGVYSVSTNAVRASIGLSELRGTQTNAMRPIVLWFQSGAQV